VNIGGPRAHPHGGELTALDPTFRTDPHPVLTRLRRDAPAHYDGVINRWVLTRHDDVGRVLRDRTMSLDPHKANEGTYMRLFLPPPGQAHPSLLGAILDLWALSGRRTQPAGGGRRVVDRLRLSARAMEAAAHHERH
jgi:hypothetical protein